MGIKDNVIRYGGTAAKYTGLQAGLGQVAGAAKSISWILVVLGVIHFILRNTMGATQLVQVFSILLFILSGYALSSRMGKGSWEVILPMILFLVWFYVFGTRSDPTFLMWYLGISFAVLALFGIFTKGKGITPELAGFLPCIFFFLDIGLLPLLTDKFSLPITGIMIGLIAFMPWWAFFGLLTLPTEEGGKVNFLINLTRIIGILYIIFVVVAPAIPNVGYQDSLLPTQKEFEARQQEVRDQISQCATKELTFKWTCLFADPTKIEACSQIKKQECEYNHQCVKIEQHKKGSASYNDCIQEQKKLGQTGPEQFVPGVVNPEIKLPTKFDFVTDEFFPTQTFLGFGDLSYTATLNYENSRTQVDVKFSCNFNQGTTIVPGKITSTSELKLAEGSGSESVTCEPTGALKGDYKLTYTADFVGLETAAEVTRFFTKDLSGAQLKEVAEDIAKAESRDLSFFSASQAAADPVILKWGFGNPARNAIIPASEKLALGLSFSNQGRGKLTAIRSYELDLPGFAAPCLSRSDLNLPSQNLARREIPIPGCTITNYPEELKNPIRDYEKRTFRAEVVYDYKLEKEIGIKVIESG